MIFTTNTSLCGTKLMVSDDIKGDIPDCNDFRKRNFGTLNLGIDGVPLDIKYIQCTAVSERETKSRELNNNIKIPHN